MYKYYCCIINFLAVLSEKNTEHIFSYFENDHCPYHIPINTKCRKDIFLKVSTFISGCILFWVVIYNLGGALFCSFSDIHASWNLWTLKYYNLITIDNKNEINCHGQTYNLQLNHFQYLESNQIPTTKNAQNKPGSSMFVVMSLLSMLKY